ncbi:MAG: hypothetical protein K2Q28_10650 [Hyphomicrobium sp.]|nr:hypothetical protein [Hyphomicrobium sp.]
MHSITVKIDQIRPLDKFDELSRGDLFARVTIAGETTTTPVKKQTSARGVTINTDWVIRRDVAPGAHPIKIELIDKDLSEDDIIDINRLDNRRVLEFTVDTQKCRVEGFATTYRCKSRINRSGREKKAAEVFFTIDVKK